MNARKSAIGAGCEAPEMEGKLYILTGQKPVQIEGTENLILLSVQASKRALGARTTSKVELFRGLSGIIVSDFLDFLELLHQARLADSDSGLVHSTMKQ